MNFLTGPFFRFTEPRPSVGCRYQQPKSEQRTEHPRSNCPGACPLDVSPTDSYAALHFQAQPLSMGNGPATVAFVAFSNWILFLDSTICSQATDFFCILSNICGFLVTTLGNQISLKKSLVLFYLWKKQMEFMSSQSHSFLLCFESWNMQREWRGIS